jgi:hypothetical protein
MGTRKQTGIWLVSLALALGAGACGDNEDEAPPKNDGGSGFTDPEEASRPHSGRVDGGTPQHDADTEDDAAAADAGEGCEASKAEADEKQWVEGCFKCAPETSAQLLNSCATGWRTFDPSDYPRSWEPGEDLPSLP